MKPPEMPLKSRNALANLWKWPLNFIKASGTSLNPLEHPWNPLASLEHHWNHLECPWNGQEQPWSLLKIPGTSIIPLGAPLELNPLKLSPLKYSEAPLKPFETLEMLLEPLGIPLEYLLNYLKHPETSWNPETIWNTPDTESPKKKRSNRKKQIGNHVNSLCNASATAVFNNPHGSYSCDVTLIFVLGLPTKLIS